MRTYTSSSSHQLYIRNGLTLSSAILQIWASRSWIIIWNVDGRRHMSPFIERASDLDQFTFYQVLLIQEKVALFTQVKFNIRLLLQFQFRITMFEWYKRYRPYKMSSYIGKQWKHIHNATIIISPQENWRWIKYYLAYKIIIITKKWLNFLSSKKYEI